MNVCRKKYNSVALKNQGSQVFLFPMLHLNVVNLGHEARRISYFHIFCVLEAGTTLENQKWKVHPEICGLRFLVSRKKIIIIIITLRRTYVLLNHADFLAG